MTLTLNMTWPVQQSVLVQVDCTEVRITPQGQGHVTRAIDNDSDIDINDAFGNGNRVHDVDRYRIRCRDGILRLDPHSGNGQDLVEGSNYQDIRPQGNFIQDTLIVILESPHKDEYRNNCIDRPIAPAQNNRNDREIIGAGIGIQNYLLDVINLCPNLRCSLSVRETRVILCNPIQFQTSLVAVICSPEWRKIRDKVWRTLWNVPQIKEEFRMRLTSYNPNYIINACTSKLQKNISDFLRQGHFANFMKYETYHPSYWNKGRKLTHI